MPHSIRIRQVKSAALLGEGVLVSPVSAWEIGWLSARKGVAFRPDPATWFRDFLDRDGIEGDPDARPTDAPFWKRARLVMPEPKKSVTIRLDADVVRFFKREPRYQTKINAVLRSYMRAHKG